MVPFFSVFTPTYNRKNMLRAVYDCLIQQTFNKFEWIIVDDGSSDGTAEEVEKWITEKKIDIVFLKQKNYGKHVAQNRALDVATGTMFLPLDDDDIIVPNALEILRDTWNTISENQREEYSGIGCCCMNEKGEVIGDKYPENFLISNDLEIFFQHKIQGEKWGCIRTDIMRHFKNNEVKGHYLSENTVWFRIAQKYKKIYINDCLRIYEIHSDSVQRKKHFVDEANSEAKYEASKVLLNEFWDWYRKYDFKAGCIQSAIASKASIESGIGMMSALKDIRPMISRLIIVLTRPYKLIYYIMRNK